MPIQLLDRDVASKIAAGEVIERPASAVKELVENSIDAGAGQIEVELARGGFDLIRVTDDAAGILEDELELAVLRHATSKLRSVNDLSSIGTLGFRGEALASIAAVARLTLVSRPPDTDAGHYVIVADNDVQERGRQGAPVGTTVFVRDLFKNVPARLAFLRSAAAEASRCVTVLNHYALAHPEVAFRVLVDGRLAFHSPGNGDASHVLLEMWGPDTASAMLPIEPTTVGGTTVSGFASEPSTTRPRRTGQIVFVNGRLVEARILYYAIADSYRDIVQRGRYPLVVLSVTVPPDEIDVNVHPTKAEVRLRREGEVIAVVQRAIRRTLAAHGVALTEIAGDGQGIPPAPQIPSAPIDSEVSLEAPPLFTENGSNGAVHPARSDVDGASGASGQTQFTLRPVGQLALTYIVAEGPDGMYLIDQHASHERVVYDQILAERRAQAPTSQGLLTPATVRLSSRQQEAIVPLSSLLSSYGFEWEPFGDDAVLLRAMPTTIKESEAALAFLEILDEHVNDNERADDSASVVSGDNDPVDARERQIAATIACHSTVRAGQSLSMSEMESLITLFREANFPRLCPHGRPTMVHLSAAQLEKQFARDYPSQRRTMAEMPPT